MQIIRNAPCPIIAIQPEFEKHLFKRIVIPIRNKPFMMDKIQYILPVAKSLKAVVHLAVFYPDVADTERNRQVSHIFNNAMSLLRENGINTSYTAKTQGRYVRDTIQIAKEKEADIVVILANQSNFFERLVGIADEEKFMRLAHIPVMTIPAEHTGLRLMKSVSDWHIAPRESQAIPAMAFDNTPSV
jgi:nucleotide-binding universal stress UspA family protein